MRRAASSMASRAERGPPAPHQACPDERSLIPRAFGGDGRRMPHGSLGHRAPEVHWTWAGFSTGVDVFGLGLVVADVLGCNYLRGTEPDSDDAYSYRLLRVLGSPKDVTDWGGFPANVPRYRPELQWGRQPLTRIHALRIRMWSDIFGFFDWWCGSYFGQPGCWWVGGGRRPFCRIATYGTGGRWPHCTSGTMVHDSRPSWCVVAWAMTGRPSSMACCA